MPAVIDFAVAKPTLPEAIGAILNRPEVDLGDQVTMTSSLTTVEINSYRLLPGEVRAYGRRFYNSVAGRWTPDRTSAATVITRRPQSR